MRIPEMKSLGQGFQKSQHYRQTDRQTYAMKRMHANRNAFAGDKCIDGRLTLYGEQIFHEVVHVQDIEYRNSTLLSNVFGCELPSVLLATRYDKFIKKMVPARYRKGPGLGLGLGSGLVCRSRLQFKRKRLFVSSPVHPGPLR